MNTQSDLIGTKNKKVKVSNDDSDSDTTPSAGGYKKGKR